MNIDGNELSSWHNTMHALLPVCLYDSLPLVNLVSQYICSLSRLVATGNAFTVIEPPRTQERPLSTVHHLALSENSISSWFDIDALAKWFPGLKALTMTQNPVVDGALRVLITVKSCLTICRSGAKQGARCTISTHAHPDTRVIERNDGSLLHMRLDLPGVYLVSYCR